MAKITYADKITLAPQPDIANENKCTADDLNEIKNSVNQIYDDLTSTGWQNIGTTNYEVYYKKWGKVVTIQCFSKANITVSGYSQTVVASIPVELVSTSHYIRGNVYCRGNSNIYSQINFNGNILIFNWGGAVTLTDAGQLSFTLTYILGD